MFVIEVLNPLKYTRGVQTVLQFDMTHKSHKQTFYVRPITPLVIQISFFPELLNANKTFKNTKINHVRHTTRKSWTSKVYSFRV